MMLRVLPRIETGGLRPLAVTDAKRSTFLPQLPTVAESGFPGFEMSYWLGLMAPTGTSRGTIDRLASESAAVLIAAENRDALAKHSAEVVTSSPDAFRNLVESDIAKWSKVIHDTGITAE